MTIGQEHLLNMWFERWERACRSVRRACDEEAKRTFIRGALGYDATQKNFQNHEITLVVEALKATCVRGAEPIVTDKVELAKIAAVTLRRCYAVCTEMHSLGKQFDAGLEHYIAATAWSVVGKRLEYARASDLQIVHQRLADQLRRLKEAKRAAEAADAAEKELFPT